jgi:hypothetical protein
MPVPQSASALQRQEHHGNLLDFSDIRPKVILV